MIIYFDGKPHTDFGLIIQPGHEHQMIPVVNNRTASIPGKDGLIDYGTTLGQRMFKLPLSFPYELDRLNLQLKIRAFVTFLNDTKGRPRNFTLTFDYDPDKYYTVRYNSSVSLERLFSIGTFELPLIAHDPFAYLTHNAHETTWDSDLIMDSDIKFEDEYVFAVTGNKTVEVNNFGSCEVAPIIEVVGSFTTLSIVCNSKTLVYNNSLTAATLTIDNAKMTAKEGTINRNNKVSGSFIELPVGINNVSITGTGLNCSVSFIFRPKFL